MKIGFIGLGLMGSRMAANLQNAGHELTIHNRTKEKAASLLETGAQWANSPKDAAANADVLITMLSDPAAVSKLASGENGFLNSLRKGKIWMDCSTVNPAFSREMGELAGKQGIRFIDSPVAGSVIPADKGELLFLAGGDKADIETCQPLYKVMGRKIIHVGSTGMGASMKMVINLLLGSTMLAFSESVVLGEKLGISQELLLNILLNGPVAAPFLAAKRDKIEGKSNSTEFPLKWMQKDLHLVSETAYENGMPLPAANVIKEIYALANRNGFGEKDFSAIYHFLKG